MQTKYFHHTKTEGIVYNFVLHQGLQQKKTTFCIFLCLCVYIFLSFYIFLLPKTSCKRHSQLNEYNISVFLTDSVIPYDMKIYIHSLPPRTFFSKKKKKHISYNSNINNFWFKIVSYGI